VSVPDTRLCDLADGRELAWAEYGVGDGAPVVAFHGSPGTHHVFAPLAEVAAGTGVRLIAPDRPGYGHSSYHRTRSYESWADDVGQLADHLGVERFAVLGTSSGGPNAAACARFLPERVVACAVVSGPAPPEAQVCGRRRRRANRVFERLTRSTPRLLAVLLQAGMRLSARTPDRTLEWMANSLPPCDAAVIARPDVRAALRRDFARPVSATAGRAAVQDLRLELRPWGFRVRDIATPVHVWHGDLDRNVVVENGVWLASEAPHASLHVVNGSGHWLVYTHFTEIVERFGAGAPTVAPGGGTAPVPP
jgi:pimeloyl-ACP methyl ester carboxylesterase